VAATQATPQAPSFKLQVIAMILIAILRVTDGYMGVDPSTPWWIYGLITLIGAPGAALDALTLVHKIKA